MRADGLRCVALRGFFGSFAVILFSLITFAVTLVSVILFAVSTRGTSNKGLILQTIMAGIAQGDRFEICLFFNLCLLIAARAAQR
jgi:hypothetical protein